MIVQTYFDPDEYWQTIEVSHHRAFGYGWRTWEWSIGLRSCFSLIPFITFLKFIRWLELNDEDVFVVYGPRIIQAIMSGSSDYLTYLLTFKMFGKEKVAEATLFMSLVNWFNFVYSTRTLSNNVETLLTLLAAFHWPIQTSTKGGSFSSSSFTLATLVIGLGILNRPSAVTHWILPGVFFICHVPGFLRKLLVMFIVGIVGIGTILFGLILDGWFYKKLTLTWWNFLKFNVIERVSDFYGTNPWHYHIFQTLPTICGTILPLILLSLYSNDYPKWIIIFIAGSVFFNSLLPHKEIRFLIPLVPFLSMMAGHGYCLLGSFAGGGGSERKRRETTRRVLWFKKIYLFFVLISNTFLGVYLSRVHQSGVIRVMDYLRDEIDNGNGRGIFFALPCHSTPFYGYLHRNVPMKFITCEPPLGLVDTINYKDETELFFVNPSERLELLLKETITSHVVLFEDLLVEPGVLEFFTRIKMHECWRGFDSHWNPDRRRLGALLVYCKV